MTDLSYFDFSANQQKPSTTSPGSPRNGSNSQIECSYLDNQRVTMPMTPPRASNSPTPQLASTFSDIQISTHALSSSKAGRVLQHGESKTLPLRRQSGDVQVISPAALNKLLQTPSSEISMLIIDLCSSDQYKTKRLRDAINIAIPPILLKRPLYTIDKIADSLTAPQRSQLLAWRSMNFIIIYDAESYSVGPGTTIHHIGAKFTTADTSERVMIVQGGLKAVERDYRSLIDHSQYSRVSPQPAKAGATDVLGGLSCRLPTPEKNKNAFHNNIRQYQDLIGGVGEPIPLKIPELSAQMRERLPRWLRDLICDPRAAQKLAAKFLKIEEEELERMQRALSSGAQSGHLPEEQRHSIAAGVERGDKNRYNNIWPFENARVHLGRRQDDGNGYINASHLHLANSDRYYIATQGPLPGTTQDFWQMIWENDIKTIVMLTRTVEGGQTKCHTYWDGHGMSNVFELSVISETETYAQFQQEDQVPIVIRNFLLSNSEDALAPGREISQIQFLEWPDLHVIQPEAILALVLQVHKMEAERISPAIKRRKSIGSLTLATRRSKPILSHCSAGCGRTGVFCTVDTVIDLVKKQLGGSGHGMDEKIDLVEKTVKNFRDQRLSMVQT